ncbi:hypothetical protein [Parahaliea mediterranea]|uniref:PQQ-binding-like beta-propeller repeat protein n=1 Tax=Parahaliea mediterranea TaxID=651086 RepID=A0A939DDA4_9GAMM|nr:hypothetical protein [Parahaliea mediterranea]MBN7796118.1 hypothetical protein [Parahaliea mediterranea]
MPCSLIQLGVAVLTCLALNARAEPLAYVARPDRVDVGIIDTVSRTIVGGIPADGRPSVVAISPDGTFGYVGMERVPTRILDTLTHTLVDDTRRQSELPVDVRQVVFHPRDPRAFLLSADTLWVVDTSQHTVLEGWVNPAPSVGLFIDDELGLLVSLSEYGELFAWSLDTGELYPSGRVVNGRIGDVGMGDDGMLYVVVDEDIVRLGWTLRIRGERKGERVSVLEPVPGGTVPVAQLVDDASLGMPLQVEPARAGTVLYVGLEEGVASVRCTEGAEPVNCIEFLVRRTRPGAGIEVSRAVIPLSASASSRGLEHHMSELLQTRDGKGLFAVGRRMMAAIDAETFELLGDFHVGSGAGYLGDADLGYAVDSCTASSTSLLALARTAAKLETSADSANRMRYRAQAAREALIEGRPEEARLKLQNFMWLAMSRSNLPSNDPDHIDADVAAELLCAAGNLIARINPDGK